MLNFDTSSPLSIFLGLLITIGVLAVSISFHEAAHAWMANRLGDPTAKYEGRISLNPMDHIDPIGTIILPIFLIIAGLPIFGWAKPTPFNPWNLKNPKRDSALISLAGPLSNFAIAIVLAVIFRASNFALLLPVIQLNLALGIFNLIPVHPLDGFKVVGGLLPKELYLQWIQLERYGPILLLALIFFGGGIISTIVSPFLHLALSFLIG